MDFKQISGLMQQAQKMQADLQEKQSALREEHRTKTEQGVAGVDEVVAEANLLGRITKLDIKPTLLKQSPEVIGQLVMAALNQALEKAEKAAQADKAGMTKDMTNGMNLPFDVNELLGGK